MTCNPNWPEILIRLKDGQKSIDRPDIVAQVFKAKKAQLLSSLSGALCGGKKIYIVWVVEYQKRGLPHAHIAVKFENEPMTPEEIDAVISAEIPENRQYAEFVERWMIHGHRDERCFKKSSR